MLGAAAGSSGLWFAIAVGCEPQDIYLFDEPEVSVEEDAGSEPGPEPEPEPDAEAPAFEPPSCESEACNECVENGDCNYAAAPLYCHPVTGSCRLPCDPAPTATGLRCPANQSCDGDLRLCVECVGSADCSDASRTACDTERGECVECVGPETCPAERRICDVENRACVECLEDGECAANQVCVEQRCVQCRDDGDCQALEDDNVCSPDNVCVECLDDADCIALDPTRPFCSQLEGECEDEEE
jgi:hypothetical protein